MKLIRGIVNGALAVSIFGVCVHSPVKAGARAYSAPISPELLMLLEASQSSNRTAPAPIDSKKPSGDDVPLPEGKGRDTTLRLCSNCHSIDRWDKQRHTPDQWSDIVDDMVGRGLQASDDDLETVNSYLSKYLAPLPKTPAPQPQPDKPPQ